MGNLVSIAKSFLYNETDFNSNGINDRDELIKKLQEYLKNEDLKRERKIQLKEDKKNKQLIKKLIK